MRCATEILRVSFKNGFTLKASLNFHSSDGEKIEAKQDTGRIKMSRLFS